MRKSILAICALLVFISTQTHAQWLSGKVKDESGSAANKVSVSFLNKDNKITTNDDGSFKIYAPNLPDTLIFSSPEHEPYKVIVTEKNIKDPNFEVVLLAKRMSRMMASSVAGLEAKSDLSEVVVVGYGKSKTRIRGAKGGKTTHGIAGSSATGSELFISSSRPDAFPRKLFAKDTAVRLGSLTAGEISDFKKWKMWEDLTAAEFKNFSSNWNLELTERYSVQLIDKNHNAVKNEKVFLINSSTGDTAWTSVTDNTGKAELWGRKSAANGNSKSSFRIAMKNGSGLKNPTAFENGINLFTVDKACATNDVVDIAFVVDATGSMSDEIEFLKLELESVLQKTADKYSKLSVRYSPVFYRDNGDAYVTKKIDFQTEMLKVLNFIKLQKADGGGDFPEAVDQALDVALNQLQWSETARAKILFLLLDAPPHDEAKAKMSLLIDRASAMGIKIIPLACSGTDKSTEYLLRTIALGTNGTYTFLTNHSGIGNKHIEPSTDSYQVELLGTLLERILEQALYAPECNSAEITKVPLQELNSSIKLKIYPNPTQGRFYVEHNIDVKELYVADFSGKLLLKIPVEQKTGRWEVNISGYPAGVYLLKYITKEGKSGYEKVILTR